MNGPFLNIYIKKCLLDVLSDKDKKDFILFNQNICSKKHTTINSEFKKEDRTKTECHCSCMYKEKSDIMSNTIPLDLYFNSVETNHNYCRVQIYRTNFYKLGLAGEKQANQLMRELKSGDLDEVPSLLQLLVKCNIAEITESAE